MSAENDYQKILEDIYGKLSSIDFTKENVISDIRESADLIRELAAHVKSEVNFQEVKEKIEDIIFYADAKNDALLKDICSDISSLKISAENTAAYLDNIQHADNRAVTKADFDDYKKQQLDLALASNENMYKAVQSIQKSIDSALKIQPEASAPAAENSQKALESVENRLNDILGAVSNLYIEIKEQAMQKNSDAGSKAVSELAEKAGYINQLVESLNSKLGDAAYFDDVSNKVDIIYENMSALGAWAVKIDKLEAAQPEIGSKLDSLLTAASDIKNVISSLNINQPSNAGLAADLDFKGLSDKINAVYENINAFETRTQEIEKLNAALPEINSKLNSVLEAADSVKKSADSITAVQNSVQPSNADSYQNLDLKNLCSKVDSVYENVNAFETRAQEMEKLNASLPEINSKLNSVLEAADSAKKSADSTYAAVQNTMQNVNTASYQNFDLENLYSKVDAVYENVNTLSSRVIEPVQADSSAPEMHLKLDSLLSAAEDIKHIISGLGSMPESSERELKQNIDLSGLYSRIEALSEGINALSSRVNEADSEDADTDNSEINAKLDSILSASEDIKDTISAACLQKSGSGIEDYSFDLEDLSNKVDIVYESLTAMNEWAGRFDDISAALKPDAGTAASIKENSDNIVTVLDKVNIISDNVEAAAGSIRSISEDINLLSDKISSLPDKSADFTEITGRMDEFASYTAGSAKAVTSALNTFSDIVINKINEINQKTSSIISDIPDLKYVLTDLSGDINTITRTRKKNTESYIYTLLDVEADFMKLYKMLETASSSVLKDAAGLKERFTELDEDITSISIRTNKLILSADDTNKEFKVFLDLFRNAINAFNEKIQDFNPEYKYGLLDTKVCDIEALLQNTSVSAENLNNAFGYLTEWIDAAGNIINDIQKDTSKIDEIKEAAEKLPGQIKLESDKSLEKLKEELTGNSDEISEEINQSRLLLIDEIKSGALELNKLVLETIQSLEGLKREDIKAMKEALAFIAGKLDGYDVEEGINRLETGANKIASGVNKIETGIDKLETQIEKLEINAEKNNTKNVSAVKELLEQSFADLRKEDIKTVNEALSFLVSKADEYDIEEGINKIGSGIDMLSSGEESLKYGIDKLDAGINAASEKIDTLETNLGKFEEKFEENTANLEKASKDTVSSGIAELKEVLGKSFADLRSEDINTVKDALSYLVSRSDEYDIETGISRLETRSNKLESGLDKIETSIDKTGSSLEKSVQASQKAGLDSINSLKEAVEKSFDELRKEDIDAVKNAISFLASKSEEYGAASQKIIAEDIPSIKEAVEKSFEDLKSEDIKTIKEALSFLVSRADEYDIEDGIKKLEAGVKNSFETGIDKLDTGIGRLGFDIESLETDVNKIEKAAEKISSKDVPALKDIITKSFDSLKKEDIEAVKNTLAFLSSKSKENDDNISRLDTGINKLESGINRLDSGIKKLSSGISGLSEASEKAAQESLKIKDIIEKSFDEFRKEDTEAMKNALAFLASKSEEYDDSFDKLEEDIEKLAEKSEKAGEKEAASIKSRVSDVLDKVNALEESLNGFGSREFSDIKALLDSVPDKIDAVSAPIEELSSKIDELSKQSGSGLSELEALMQKKINKQNDYIVSLENKIDEMNAEYSLMSSKIDALSEKYDNLVQSVKESGDNTNIKDILDNISSQLAAISKSTAVQQDNQKTNTKILIAASKKVAGFDDSIKKIVSYLEEE